MAALAAAARSADPPHAGSALHRTGQGRLRRITMVTGQQWLDFCAMVECPQLEEIEQLRFQIGRWSYRDLIREQIGPWMAERTVEEIVELGQLFRLPIAALGNGSTIRDMDYATQRGVFDRNPAGFHQPRPPWLMSACGPAPVRATPVR